MEKSGIALTRSWEDATASDPFVSSTGKSLSAPVPLDSQIETMQNSLRILFAISATIAVALTTFLVIRFVVGFYG